MSRGGKRDTSAKPLIERLTNVSKSKRQRYLSLAKLQVGNRPQPDLGGLHPIAQYWYDSLRTSAQSVLYEDSDWALAVTTAVAIHDLLVNGTTLGGLRAIIDANAHLLCTESSRRRAKVNIERGLQTPDERAAEIIRKDSEELHDDYGARLAKAG